eukprot:13883913-Ditylum_brightwellii.AAC.1
MRQYVLGKKHQKGLKRKKSGAEELQQLSVTNSSSFKTVTKANISIKGLCQMEGFLAEYPNHSLGDVNIIVFTCVITALETMIEDLNKFIKAE